MGFWGIFTIIIIDLAAIGISVLAIRGRIKARKIKKHFSVSKGMSYDHVIMFMGEPDTRKHRGEYLFCSWKITLDEKPGVARIVFVDNKVKRIT